MSTMKAKDAASLDSTVKKTQVPAGEPPVFIGDLNPCEALYSLIQYDKQEVAVIIPEGLEEMLSMLESGMVNWININGLADLDAFKRLCRFFKIDSLTVEDLLNTHHRPKVEDFGHYLIVITKMLTRHPDLSIEYEQVSFILTGTTIISIQETPGDCFDPVRNRLKTETSKLRKFGGAYLLYALMDVIVDSYFDILEHIGADLEKLEAHSLTVHQAASFMAELQEVKTTLNRMRRILWPVRETVSALLHSDSDLLDEGLTPYLRDLSENIVQVLEALESFRETASGIQEVHLSSLSNRMNEVMKVLTIISTLFIPLTFIVGVYGMNFKFMPELASKWGYPAVWTLMLLLVAGMLLYFKRRKWL